MRMRMDTAYLCELLYLAIRPCTSTMPSESRSPVAGVLAQCDAWLLACHCKKSLNSPSRLSGCPASDRLR
jgi:hypothetical protein